MEDIEDEDADTYRDIVRDPLRHGAAGYNLAPVCRPKSPPKVGRVVHSSNRFLISVWRRFFCFGGLMYTDATRKTGGFAMFVLTNRLIIALAAVSSALLMATVALWFPAWAHSHAPTLNLIPGIWRPHPEPEMVRWTTYVIGAGELGGFIATMIIHGKLPVKQAAAIFCAAAVLGTLSWWNPFLVVAGIWLVFATMYATKRFDTENLARTANREPFVLGRALGSRSLDPHWRGIFYGYQIWVRSRNPTWGCVSSLDVRDAGGRSGGHLRFAESFAQRVLVNF